MSISELEQARLEALEGLAFAKMTGSGNDFVLLDNRRAGLDPKFMPLLAKGLCARGNSVGADGLIVLEPSDRVDPKLGPVDFRWHFFNADGSSAEMCGNGGRCAARWAFEIGLAGYSMVFDTLAGPIRAWVNGSTVKLEMVSPKGAYQGVRLEDVPGQPELCGINTGVPHAVIFTEDLETAPVKQVGRLVRFHQHFAPAGANVNFAQALGGQLWVRTYERGVEDETLACGTGAVAAALMAGPRFGMESPVTVRVRSGEELKVHFRSEGEGFSEVFLEGAARHVYAGSLHREAFAWLKA